MDNTQFDIWCLCWINYCTVLLNTKFEFRDGTVVEMLWLLCMCTFTKPAELPQWLCW